MTLSILKIEIPRRGNFCNHCQKTFESGENYYSALSNKGRKDFCASCWMLSSPSKCSWKATFPHKKDKRPLIHSKLDRLIDSLKASIEENPSEALLLALYLARKKILISRKEFKEQEEVYHLFEMTSTGELLAIKKQPLITEHLDAIKQNVASKLAG